MWLRSLGADFKKGANTEMEPKMKTLIAVPCMDTLDVEFVRSLVALERVEETQCAFLANSLVYAAREKLCQHAVESGADYLLFLDSDMTFTPDMFKRLKDDIEKTDADIVTGLCFRRRPPYTPCIWKKLRMGLGDDRIEEDYNDYPADSFFEIDACGMAACLIKTSVLYEVFKEKQTCFQPLPTYGEDVSFCIRAKQLGFKIYCDSSIKVGHVAKTIVQEETFKAYTAAIARKENNDNVEQG